MTSAVTRPSFRPSLSISADGFRLGDAPFRLLGGAMHYFRTPAGYWRDRLLKLKALGCNTVETYVAWNVHEPKRGRYRFDDMLDLDRFIATADEVGLHVIVRPGPYICAEWDLGALPCWLLAEDLALRCADPAYLAHVDAWFDVLIPRIAKHLTTRGGPVIAVQIENEYGYFGNDGDYLRHLRDGLARRGIDVPLFTSDGTYQRLCVEHGGIDGHLRTANFGSLAADRFRVLREAQPDGPLACMEFWVGWFDTWGDEKHHTRPAEETARNLDDLLSIGEASANIYMFHGGTNFGFTAGGNLHETFKPFVTSYDYDALLTECGDTTPKYDACRAVLHKHLDTTPAPHGFTPSSKRAFGRVTLGESCPLDDALDALSSSVRHATPQSFEKLATLDDRFDGNGFVLYRTTLGTMFRGQTLGLRDMHDWCHVMLDGRPLATWYRNDPMPPMTLDFAGDRARLEILVAHLARSNFGERMTERKGFAGAYVGGPSVNDRRAIFGWTHHGLSFDNLSRVPFTSNAVSSAGPLLRRGTFDVDEVADTFLYLPDWTIGCAFVNGFNLGRYWSVGPQRALYVPATTLKLGRNELVIFEAAGGGDAVELRAEPALD